MSIDKVKEQAELRAAKLKDKGKALSTKFLISLGCVYVIEITLIAFGVIPEGRVDDVLKATDQAKELVTWFFVTVAALRGGGKIVDKIKGNG